MYHLAQKWKHFVSCRDTYRKNRHMSYVYCSSLRKMFFRFFEILVADFLVGNKQTRPICGSLVRYMAVSSPNFFFITNGQKFMILSKKNILPPQKKSRDFFFWRGDCIIFDVVNLKVSWAVRKFLLKTFSCFLSKLQFKSKLITLTFIECLFHGSVSVQEVL